jgi:predicted metal-binding protein
MAIDRSKKKDGLKNLNIYCEWALAMGIDGAKVIRSQSILTGEWVRMKCQFGCPMFGKRFTCPPRAPAPEVTQRVIDSYRKAIMLHKRLGKKERTKGFDERRFRLDFNRTIVRLETEIFLDGYYKAWSMGSGYCRLCKTCDPAGFCRHGFEARPAMEACGIDVFGTARGNGFPIDVVRTHEEESNFFGVILVE